jgi:Fic family protein
LLYLSAYFERDRQEYSESLLAVSQKGAWNDWIAFFLRGVAEQAMDGVQRANRLLQLRAHYHLQVQSARSSALLVQLIDYLFESPAVTAAQVKERLGVTPRTAQAHIERLAAEGVIREATGKKRNRVYLADEILRAATDDSIDRDST